VQAVQPGSWLAVFHPAGDILAHQMREVERRLDANTATPATLRSRAQVLQFFDGLELLPPGLVQVHRWQPGSAAADTGDEVPGYAGLASKP
jgi:S-adenosyl methyltransferase